MNEENKLFESSEEAQRLKEVLLSEMEYLGECCIEEESFLLFVK